MAKETYVNGKRDLWAPFAMYIGLLRHVVGLFLTLTHTAAINVDLGRPLPGLCYHSCPQSYDAPLPALSGPCLYV